MSIDYRIYSPDTGELLLENKYAGLDVFLDCSKYGIGKTCIVHQDIYLENIDHWTVDESDELWKKHFSLPIMMTDGTDCCLYFTKEEVLTLSTLMCCNNKLLTKIMGNHNGLIVQIY